MKLILRDQDEKAICEVGKWKYSEIKIHTDWKLRAFLKFSDVRKIVKMCIGRVSTIVGNRIALYNVEMNSVHANLVSNKKQFSENFYESQ